MIYFFIINFRKLIFIDFIKLKKIIKFHKIKLKFELNFNNEIRLSRIEINLINNDFYFDLKKTLTNVKRIIKKNNFITFDIIKRF